MSIVVNINRFVSIIVSVRLKIKCNLKNNYGFSPVMFLLFLGDLQYLLDFLNAFLSNKNRLLQTQYLTT